MSAALPSGSVIGIIGGGQLGRMTALAAAELGYKTHIYCPEADSPAFQVTDRKTVAAYDDAAALQQFAKAVNVLTFEFENIPSQTVQLLAQSAIVRPHWKILHIAQNRLREKQFVRDLGIGTAEFREVTTLAELQQAVAALGVPCILKTVEQGYDGKGQYRLTAESDLAAIWQAFRAPVGIVEAFVPFEKEISVVLARGVDGKSVAFPVVENVHRDGILATTIAPASIATSLAQEAQQLAIRIAEAAEMVGMLAVEFFVTKTGQVLVNEMAPRPHNSGHWTMDACHTSQFEQFVRAVAGLPLGSVQQYAPARMENLIGEAVIGAERYLQEANAKLHIYGKNEVKPGRKMGHVTWVG